MESQFWEPVCRRPSGLVSPVGTDPVGLTGPTWKVANGPRWRKTGPDLYVPASTPQVVEQRIIEQAARLSPDGSRGCVTGWAGLRWRGAAYFDGHEAHGGGRLPVPLALGGGRANLRPNEHSAIDRCVLALLEREVLDGLPVTTVQRALFDEIVRRNALFPAVQAIDMTAGAGLISVWLFAVYVGNQNSRNGAPLARAAVELAVDECRSPREAWMYLVWRLDAELPDPMVNVKVYDLEGRLIGIPDLFDAAAGLVGEYGGGYHLDARQHRADLAREERFRDHGLEYVEIVRGDSRAVAAARIRSARSRAKYPPPESCAWTLERPPWDPAPETLDARLERMGMVEQLTRG